MERKRRKEIYIIGHKNPDTDSVCSAIAYASLKNEILHRIETASESNHDFLMDEVSENEEIVYVPVRAGQLNTETDYVLKRFGQKIPGYMHDLRTQIKDIKIRRISSISADYSLKQAWEKMRESDASTLAVTRENGTLEGLITMSDIAGAYMSVLDNEILSEACTPIANILDTLKGTLVVGELSKRLTKGKLVVSTANLSVINDFIEESDLVILGNRYEAQLCAIENHASCIIICDGAKASRTICKMAETNGCAIICTPYDTYTVTRTINQSIPVNYFMIKEGIISFSVDDYVGDIKPIMMKKRHRDFIIVDAQGHYEGMISRRTLISMACKKVILVDHNEMEQAALGLDEAEVIEIIDHHKLGTVETSVPVNVRNEPVGCTATIIYEMYVENQIPIKPDIAGILCASIISDTLMFRSPTCTAIDQMAAEELARISEIDIETFAMQLFEESSRLKTKTESEIFYQDYKRFIVGELRYGVGQITSLNRNEMFAIQERLIHYMHHAMKDTETTMLFFMLTDILNQSTRLLFVGKDAKRLVENSFQMSIDGDYIDVDGLVSRKKQLIPKFTQELQQW